MEENQEPNSSEEKSAYGNRPLWQWILLYVVIGAVVYGLIYYFFLSGRGTSLPYSY